MSVLRSYSRTWAQHTGVQFATLSVLCATFAVVGFVFVLSVNFNNLLTRWGSDIRVTAYLSDELEEPVDQVEAKLAELTGIKEIKFVSKDEALKSFNLQLKDITPEFLKGDGSDNPLPDAFEIVFEREIRSEEDYNFLTQQAGLISAISGVEDVSYGQSWLKNYSSFVSGISTSGVIVVFILLLGSLFIIGNAIRSSISSRIEEIEILELVGATRTKIRMPFVFEGFMTCMMAGVIGLFLAFFMFSWARAILEKNIALARLNEQISFISPMEMLSFLLLAGIIGAIGSFITIKGINDGWSASQQAIE